MNKSLSIPILFLIPFGSCCRVVSLEPFNERLYSSEQSASFLDTVDENDALLIARKIAKEATKSSEELIKNVVCFYGQEGKPLMYGVNYSNGYVLISASKHFFPIIAQSEYGYFDGSLDSLGPSSMIIEDILQSMQNTSSMDYVDYSPVWEYYVACQAPFESNYQDITKSGIDDYDDAYSELLDYLNDNGYSYFSLHRQGDLPDDVYEHFCSIAEENNDGRFDWRHHSFVAFRDNHQHFEYGNKLLTKWHQDLPYSAPLPSGEMMGCVTIAVAQLMKHHQKPDYYYWNQMPDDTTSYSLNSFLVSLRNQLCVTSNGGATYENAYVVLTNYGYSVLYRQHNTDDIKASLYHDNPVIMFGTDYWSSVGHAWICDSYSLDIYYTEYHLFTIEPYSTPVVFEESESYSTDPLSFTSYHYNWGSPYTSTGWYYDSNIVEDGYNFCQNRLELIVSYE